jgi:acetylornithine deacetylase/succinyl-diaminopimelate desuccinylase-like protein
LNGTLPFNVKFLIEGEEEVGGASIEKYVAESQGKLAANVALVSDTAMYADGVPTLCIGLRGLIYMEVQADGPARDLHSGLYSGAAPNAVYGLIELLAKAKDVNGTIQIPGIYDDVEEPAVAELDSWKRLPFDEKEFLTKEVGSSVLTGEPHRSIIERVWSRPTFEVHGSAGGFTAGRGKDRDPSDRYGQGELPVGSVPGSGQSDRRVS